MGRPSGPVTGSSSEVVSSGINSFTGTSLGTSALRLPPEGSTIVTGISAIFTPSLCGLRFWLSVSQDKRLAFEDVLQHVQNESLISNGFWVSSLQMLQVSISPALSISLLPNLWKS